MIDWLIIFELEFYEKNIVLFLIVCKNIEFLNSI